MQFFVNMPVKFVKIKVDLKSLRVPQRVYNPFKIHNLYIRKLFKFSIKINLQKVIFLENLNHIFLKSFHKKITLVSLASYPMQISLIRNFSIQIIIKAGNYINGISRKKLCN